MRIPVTVEYREAYLPTPRCRKYRYRDTKKEVNVNVREVPSEKAPVAMLVLGYNDDYTKEVYTEYRYYGGKFYTPAKWSEFNHGKTGPLPVNMLHRYIYGNYDYWNHDFYANRKAYQDDARRFLIIDGEVWHERGEPRYCIYTFGLGHNHGGTSLSVDNYYNCNIGKSRYFSALDGELAVQKANEVAAGRGDTNDVGHFKQQIKVLMPETVKVKPQKQHGDGDPFTNSIEQLINGSGSAMEAGFLAIAFTAAEINHD